MKGLFRLLADVGEDTAVHIEDMTVHGIRSVAGEEDNGATEFIGIEPTASRRFGDGAFRHVETVGDFHTTRLGMME